MLLLSPISLLSSNHGNLLHAYNELAVGDVFRRLGFQIEYEKLFTFGDKIITPDWYVTASEKCRFAVEVFTPSPSEHMQNIDRKWAYLFRRIEDIHLGYMLEMDRFDYESAPDQRQVKRIVGVVKNWLELNPGIGAETEVSDIGFIVKQKNPEAPHVVWYAPKSFEVNIENLRENIIEKSRKYRELKSLGVGLIVGVVPNYSTGINIRSLSTVVWGTEVLTRTGEVQLINNGLFTQTKKMNESLSAVMWTPKQFSVPLELSAIHFLLNPNAALRLPPECMNNPIV